LFVFSAYYTLSLILCRYYVLAYLPDCIMGIDWRLGAALCLSAFAGGHTVYKAGTDYSRLPKMD